MNSNVKLQACQKALLAQKVKDVKFFFNTTSETPVSQFESDAADVLDAMLNGKYKPAKRFGDSYGLKN